MRYVMFISSIIVGLLIGSTCLCDDTALIIKNIDKLESQITKLEDKVDDNRDAIVATKGEILDTIYSLRLLINTKLEQHSVEIAKLDVKAGVWGGLSGLVVSVLTIVGYIAIVIKRNGTVKHNDTD